MMMTKKALTILLLLLSCLGMAGKTTQQSPARQGESEVPAKEWKFRQISITEGLPDNRVEGVMVLPDGRLGIRMPSVFCIYDGCRYKTYPFPSRRLYYWARHNVPLAQYLDGEGRVWIKDWNVLHVFDLLQERFVENVDSLLRTKGITGQLSNLWIDDDGTFRPAKNDDIYASREFVVMADGVLEHKDGSHDSTFIGMIKPDDRVVMKQLEDGDTWMMWDCGLAYYNKKERLWIDVMGGDTGMAGQLAQLNDVLTAMDVDNEGNAFVGTGKSGAFLICRKGLGMSRVMEAYDDITNIAVNSTTGDVWVATMHKGLAYSHPLFNAFAIQGMSANSMLQLADGTIVLSSTDGLFTFNHTTGQVQRWIAELEHKFCRALYADQSGRLWVGTFYDGLYCIERGRVVHHYFDPHIKFSVFGSSVNPNSINAILQDSSGQMYVAARGGLCLFDAESGVFTPICTICPQTTNYASCTAVLQGPEPGMVIVGTTNGLYHYHASQRRVWRPDADAPNDHRFLHSSAYYNCIMRDSHGLTWFGTQHGLNVADVTTGEYNKSDGAAVCLTQADGLPDNVIKAMVEDIDGNIWVATNSGIARVDVSRGDDGRHNYVITTLPIQTNAQFIGSTLATADGTIMFGTSAGIMSFKPRALPRPARPSRPLITAMLQYGKAVSTDDDIVLRHNENCITIEFSGLNFLSPDRTYYRYRLDGTGTDWVETCFDGSPGHAEYLNLPPGDYTFRLYAAAQKGQWGDECAKLHFIIRPPFWQTPLAYIIYILLLASLVAWAARLWWQHQRKRIEARQHEEMEQMKFRFFTNISHELRTPLTLIITPLEAYLKEMEEGEGRNRLQGILRNANNLLSLVNQLLDFRRVEMNGERLNLTSGNLTDYVQQCCESFNDMARERGLMFAVDVTAAPRLQMHFDRDKVHKILNNLLSNAFKFTPKGGMVKVTLTPALSLKGEGGLKSPSAAESVEIRVSDTGVGIAKDELPHIFERFYQAKDKQAEGGSGIGLHLVKELCELHHGSITAESQVGMGTTFIVMLPINLEGEDKVSEDKCDENLPLPEGGRAGEGVLIVEDNPEFRHFLCEQLSTRYRVLSAADGIAGLELAAQENPDIIISDVMMPHMDGIEMCRRIKEDINTSHIPVILLTARASDESRAEGYGVGADAYITKPFGMDVLLARVGRLIEQHRQRVETFQKKITVEPSAITITSLDEQLVQKALQCVERNMDNDAYSVEQLASDLAMTRTTLYRKLMGIMEQTPVDFIRTVRLKRAAQLLRDTDLTVNEIADRTGFGTPRYFTTQFKKAYGMTPSQFAAAEAKLDA